ncbi:MULTISPECIES: ABC transporter ATP-binding protein [unclassified Rhodococcus (in: high G+C Gram-positive bacteria)]|uniref:dipeptide ABC transporter ATP-binding protein n=1 Tax=unclassified Rhodococcus (in: high G+C Gram-positive bacteria) TaxID=192944 RepID=UPI0016397E37|nr:MULTISPECIES: ABC transporter ATP-binding protein [unclassified Rhodococcus (in: high G+C Gram-positive bacteria)]MBC2642659.1 ABC transporter ATP-binding protein [Rhodococcus sp. 3A]MBC2892599.1 ABC transporter ATP-binding protein [Rhodococcus sp. 4CII]
MTGEPLLEIEDLRVSFPSEEGRIDAVRGVSYGVSDGEVLAIAGESGSGKSVASLAVMGLLPEHARVTGSIRLQGRELLGLGDRELSALRGKTVSMVFQDPLSALTPVHRVGDQIAEALLVHGRASNKKDAAQRAVDLLDLVGIPDPAARAKAFPHEFSGGMRQRVVIAIAIANDPALIICDEPTTALDVTVQAQILNLLRKARDLTGAGVVMITHDMGIAATLADRVVVMYAGRVVESAPVRDLFAEPRMPYTAGLLVSVPRMDAPIRSRLVPIAGAPPALHALPPGCTFAPRCPLVVDACRLAEPDLVATGPGHRAACIRVDEVATADLFTAYRRSQPDPAAAGHPTPEHRVVLRVTDLVKTYPITRGLVFRRTRGEIRAVDGISFDIRGGRTLALVGESGSGKSTTLTQILELAAPESGSIEVLGADVAALSKHRKRELRRKMAIVFQDPTASLDPRLPVFDVLAEPLRLDGRGRDEIGRRVPQLLDLVGLRREHADRYPADFSGGQKQRISIARALALDPELLILDEPVSSLDVSIQAGVLNLLRDLQEQRGMSYLFVSHDLSVVRNIAHDVAVMFQGRIVESGPAEAIFADPQHEYTRALLEAIPVPDPTFLAH